MKAKLFIASSALAAMAWAAPTKGAAHFARYIAKPVVLNHSFNAAQPRAARFQIEKNRGLLLHVWINQAGPYLFALDTGAGMNVISQRVVTSAGLPTKAVPKTFVGGLSSARLAANREAIINQMAVGELGNNLAASQTALIVSSLPSDIDGILDPTQAYAPYGYSIDIPNEQLSALEGSGFRSQPGPGAEGARVAWVRKTGDNRPFVRLGDGRVALVDTGSGFGLAVSERNAIIVGTNRANGTTGDTTDLAGGVIRSRRVMPTTIRIGELTLRRIPTDILFGIPEEAPLILGRDALYPFKISFDPQRRSIEFVTSTPHD